MTRLWMSGLEAGSLDVCHRVDSDAAISAAQARTGRYSLHIPTVDDRVWVGLGNGYMELFLRIGLYVTGGSGGNDRTFCTLLDAVGDELLTFQVRDADRVLLVRRGDYNDTLIASGGVVPTNSWCCVEVRALIDDTSGIVQVEIDGAQVIDFGGDTQAGTTNKICVVAWGASPVAGNYVCCGYYDDLAINDPSGSRNNSWIGQGGIVGLVPTGAGNYTQLTPSAGANWQCVDEVPPDDDGTHVEQATISRKDTYKMQDLSVTPGHTTNIAAVQWLCRAHNTVSGSRGLARLLRIAGVDYQGSDVGYDKTYDYHPEIMGTSPATGAAWTESEVNSLEAGVVVR